MKALALRHGDLVLDSGRCVTVSGRDKLIQDLSLWLRERISVGPTTPTFGSRLIDMVGSSYTDETLTDIETEILRILSLYQAYQLNRIKASYENGEPIRYLAHEVLDEVREVRTRALADRIIADVTIITLGGVEIPLTVMVSESEVSVG